MVPVGHEQCIGHVEGTSLVNGSLIGFNNAYDTVDVDNVMRMDVARANEKEVIAGMPKLGDGPKGWSQEHMAFEEASRVPLFERSTLSSLASTLFIMNCCHTHGKFNTFISKLLGLLKNNILPNPNTLPSSKHKAFRTMK
jgi:hypothetical protein